MNYPNSNLFKVIPILKSTWNTLWEHKIIFSPFLMTAFIQVILLEIFYFSVRYPLNIFFAPLISRLWNDTFLHYPLNLILLPKLFQYGQVPIYIFIGTFFTTVAISMIESINNDHKVDFGQIIKNNMKLYVHIVAAGIITFFFIWGYSEVYEKVVNRALLIQASEGMKGALKKIVIEGGPYLNLLFSSFVGACFAYVLPVIALEKKKFGAAMIANFRIIIKSFWFTFGLVFLPALIYVPIILLRNYSSMDVVFPEWRVLVLALSIFIMVVIDAIVYTALTTVYLLKKEQA